MKILHRSPPYVDMGPWHKLVWFVAKRNEVVYVHRFAWPFFSLFAWLAMRLAQFDGRKTWIQREIERE